MPAVNVPFDRRHNIDGTQVKGNVEVEVVLSSSEVTKVRLQAVLVKKTGGAGVATNRPRVYLTSGDAADAVSERWRAGAATPAGDLINTYNILRPFTTIRFPSGTNAGKYGFYFIIDGDAANDFTYELFYEVLN
jgi:hypothetical protein